MTIYRNLVTEKARKKLNDRLFEKRSIYFWLFAGLLLFGFLYLFPDLNWKLELAVTLLTIGIPNILAYLADVFIIVPNEIYVSQKGIIDAVQAKQLNIEVTNVSMSITDKHNVQVPAILFHVLNKGNIKIVEMEANLLQLVVRGEGRAIGLVRRLIVLEEIEDSLEWFEGNKSIINLTPRKYNEVILAHVDDKRGRVIFRPNEITGTPFQVEAL